MPPPKPGGKALEYGIYPGGVAGQVGVPAEPKPENQNKTLAALAQLRPKNGPFTLHIYRAYMTPERQAEEEAEHRRLVDLYTGRGYGVEIVIRYRRDNDPAGFAKFVRGVVARFGDNPLVRGFQVTNEVNFTASGDSSDGIYEGSRDALIQGIIAAKKEARLRGYSQLKIGFNWFYRTTPDNEESFWNYLDHEGGKEFVDSLDWVGLDVYPGTFFPPSAPPDKTGDFVINALSQMRQCHMPAADIPASVPIHVEENGYPTGPGRSYADQLTALRSMVNAVNTYRANYNVTHHFWFDLRDADSDSPNFQQQYGLMRHDYTPKPAFGAFRELIAKNSLRNPPPPGVDPGPPAAKPRTVVLSARCYRRGVYAQVRGAGVPYVDRVLFTAGGKKAPDEGRPWRRHIRFDPAPKRRRFRVRAAVEFPKRTVVLKRSLRCRPRAYAG